MVRKLWLAAGFLAGGLALPAAAQDPKPGDYYEDHTDLGFKVKMPARWEPIPPAPDEGNLIIKYDPKSTKFIELGPGDELFLHAWVLKFDRRKNDAPPAPGSSGRVSLETTLEKWIKKNVGEDFEGVGTKEIEVAKVAATEHLYSGKQIPEGERSRHGKKVHTEPVNAYAVLYKLRPDVDVAVVFNGPGAPRKWSKYENSFKEMARSFRTIEVKGGKSEVAAGASLRDRKRAELADAVTRTPGWSLYETPRYFIISNNEDKAFIEELKGRLEAIRSIYEQDYPAAKAEEIRLAAARAKTGDAIPKTEASSDAAAQAEPKEEEPALPSGDRMEMSRCSIVRVCKNRQEYHSYGGPAGSAGYWSANARELVLYDDKAEGGRGDTWIVLNHEAFHQYIYYFYGNIAPHSWYNEGTGDFYSGYAYKNGRFTLEKNSWRKEAIKEAIREERFVPLKDFLRWTQQQYYSENAEFRSGPAIHYAQGWSLIYFLRTGKQKKAKGWDPKWDDLLENYLRVLAATSKPNQAIEQCLTGIDLDALEAAWIEYTK